jgi:FKBP12-rapamycin complex-associated protein
MFSSGISQVLVEALREMAATMPDLLSSIQERLLDELSMVLAHKLFWAHPGSSSITNSISQSASNSNEKQQPEDTNLIALALNTLGSFNFATHVLTEFVKECVVGYLDNESA